MKGHTQLFPNSVAAAALLLLVTPGALCNRTANHFDDENAVYGQAVWHTNTSESVVSSVVFPEDDTVTFAFPCCLALLHRGVRSNEFISIFNDSAC